MGGVPTLLMVATLGITYGWQPDGKDGVEYVIQIPPDQLQEIQRLGEISSTIDPAVRGRVSRVIVRVGDGPLPRTSAPDFSHQADDRGSYVAQTDHTPMPVPASTDLREAIPIRGIETASKASVMKPQTNDANRDSGFTLPPSLRSFDDGSAANSAQMPGARAQNEFNAAAKRFGTAADATVASGSEFLGRAENVLRNPVAGATNVPPPADPRSQSLQFTGSDPQGMMARTRAGGPSTDPINPRDNTWSDLTGRRPDVPSTDPPGAATGFTAQNFPSSNAVNPAPATGNMQRQPVGATDVMTSGRSGATGLTPNDPFGRLPAGVAPSNAGQDPSSLYPATNRNTTANSFQTQPTQGAPFNAADSRPTAAQLATLPPGTFTVDVYGRPVDRDGRRLDPNGRPIDPYTTAMSNPPADEPFAQNGRIGSSLGTPNTYPPNTYPSTVYPPNTYSSDANSARGTTNPYPQSSSPQSSSDARFARDNRPDLRSDRTIQTLEAGSLGMNSPTETQSRNSRPADAETTRRPVSAQPLFNGLLLISFVANIYLIFWLKNLRHQFKDLITAKRMAASDSASL